MKSRFALLALLVVAAAPLAAQGGGGGGGRRGGGGGGGGRGGMNVDNMATLYSLTADQKTKTQALVDDYNKSIQPLQAYIMSQTQAAATVPPDSAKKATDLRADFNTKFKALLTPEQATKFDSVQAQQATRRRGGGGGGGGR